MSQHTIVVIGAGVAGLTTALLLSRNPAYKVVVAAKHMPGDYDLEYASPWAGASFTPLSAPRTEAAEWDRVTWYALRNLADNFPGAGISYQECEIQKRNKDNSSPTGKWYASLTGPNPWIKDLLPNFRVLPPCKGVDAAIAFTTLSVNTAIYLPWLVSQCLEQGVKFQRRIFKHIKEAKTLITPFDGNVSLVVNCTGLMASRLGGVEDKTVYPVRGQVVVVRNDGGMIIGTSGTDDGPDETCYVISRTAAGGTILGGTYQEGNWDCVPDPSTATRIMKRAVELCPALTDGKGIEHLDIIRHGVGLRPAREGGTRVEKELIQGLWVVHNYGAGGAGYQCSYGCAEKAVRLVDKALESNPRL